MSDESQQKQVFKDPKTQDLLNKPPEDPNGLSADDEAFLSLVLSLIDEGKIDLHTPSTLINNDVYDKLDSKTQGKVDLEAMNLLNSIRQIKELHDNGFAGTFQMNSLVSSVSNVKERLEVEDGDIFII